MFNKIIKSGGGCCGSDTVIWSANDNTKYGSKVFTDIKGENVTIYLVTGEIIHYGKSYDGWQKTSNKISLNISKTSSTIQYDFVHDGETRTFTAKPGYLFQTVLLAGAEVFWKSSFDQLCSDKVIIYGVESTIRNVNIFLKDRSVIHFHKADYKWVSTTAIVLNIDINSNNDRFEYRATRGFGHFNPKPNLKIRKIVKAELDIWEAKVTTVDGKTYIDHGLKVVLMGSGKKEKYLSILLQSGRFVLLQKIAKGQPWVNITKNKHNFQGIKLFSLDEGTSKYHELTREDYDPIVFECRYGYEFREGVRCVKITDKDMLLWTHTEDTEFGYPKGFYLDLLKNSFTVTNLKDQSKTVVPVIPEIVPVSAALAKAAPVTKVTLDIEKNHLGDQIDYSQVGMVYTFVPNPGHAFSKITMGKTFIWQCKDVCVILVMIKSKESKKYVAILLEDYSFSLLEQSDVNTWTDVTHRRYDITKLKFYGDDKELKSSDYKVTLVNYSYEFKFNDVNCRNIKYGDDEVWKSADDPNYSTIKMFHLGLISNTFFVLNSKSQAKKLDYRGPITPTEPAKITLDIENKESTTEYDYTDDPGVITYTPKSEHLFNKVLEGQYEIWKSVANVFGKLVRTKAYRSINYPMILLTNRTFILYQEGETKWIHITKERHDVTGLKFLGEAVKSKILLILNKLVNFLISSIPPIYSTF